MWNLHRMQLAETSGESLVETRPSAEKQESPAEKNVVTSDSARKQRKKKVRKQRKKRSQTSCDPLPKLVAGYIFGILQDISRDKEFQCDDMEHVRLLQDISDGIVTKGTMQRNLVEYCEELAMKER